jgi:hypothetical protein
MLREKIAKIIYEGYTGMPWPDEDEHFNEAARKHADEIMELPEIKQALAPEKVKEARAYLIHQCNVECREYDYCKTCMIEHALTILKEADHE